MTAPRWTPNQVREHYRRLGRPVPGRVEKELGMKNKRPAGQTQAGHEIRFYDIEPGELVIKLPFTYQSRNIDDAMNVFARNNSRKAYRALVQHYLQSQGVRAFRSRVTLQAILYVRYNRNRDDDDWSYKNLADALKGWVFVDDCQKYVRMLPPEFVVVGREGKEKTVVMMKPIKNEDVKTGWPLIKLG